MNSFTAYTNKALISAHDLKRLLQDHPQEIALLDASYGVGANGLSPDTVFQQLRISKAQAFDIDVIADQNNPLPHMLPQPSEFETAVGQLGISNHKLVVIYDQTGIAMAASRAWWMFRVFGHDNVCVLDGGLPAWHAAGLPFETEAPTPPLPATFSAYYRPHLVKLYDQMLDHVQQGDATILDSRPPEYFAGMGGSGGPASGHMPGALNLPATALIDRQTRGLISSKELQAIALKHPIHFDSPVIATCGSGVTACVSALAFFQIGYENLAVYDGSWTEWSLPELSSPVIKGFE